MSEHDADPTVTAPPAGEPPSPKPVKPVDWESRFKESQAAFTRKAQELAEYRRTHPDVEPDDGEDDDEGEGDDRDVETAPTSRFRPRIPESDRAPASTAYDSEGAELGRAIAEQVYGADALRDFDRALELYESAQTTADRVSAFQAFADLRARSASSSSAPMPPTSRRPTRDELVTPTVQTNRPDAVYPDGEPSTDRYLGGANGGVAGWLKEKFAAGRNPR